ncbi:flavonol 3-O-glucosyltransferase UGT89B1-like [Miscanthus floridulus]|uniref:flavonol 3-O-glucosyltransferase UGT89B1-like n=1 Tax=Miscanthus floridulus TaxID=154761 RepID=UPI0034584E60
MTRRARPPSAPTSTRTLPPYARRSASGCGPTPAPTPRTTTSPQTGESLPVISDFFCWWMQQLAAEAGVPWLVFAPSGVLATAATHSLFRRMPRPPEGDAGRGYAVSFPALPGAPSYPWRQISRMYRSYAEGGRDEHSEGIKDNFLWNMEGAAFLCNTCHPLEGKYLEAQPLEDLASKRIANAGERRGMTDSARQAIGDGEGGVQGQQWPRLHAWSATARSGTTDEAPAMHGSDSVVAEEDRYGGSGAAGDGASWG